MPEKKWERSYNIYNRYYNKYSDIKEHVKNEKLWTNMHQSVYKLQNNAVKNTLLFLVFKKYLLHCIVFCLGLVQANPLKPKIMILKINLFFLL